MFRIHLNSTNIHTYIHTHIYIHTYLHMFPAEPHPGFFAKICDPSEIVRVRSGNPPSAAHRPQNRPAEGKGRGFHSRPRGNPGPWWSPGCTYSPASLQRDLLHSATWAWAKRPKADMQERPDLVSAPCLGPVPPLLPCDPVALGLLLNSLSFVSP